MITVSATWTSLETYKYLVKSFRMKNKHFGEEIPESFYKLCLSKIGNKINYFESKVGHSKLILKWKLMVPLERSMPDELS